MKPRIQLIMLILVAVLVACEPRVDGELPADGGTDSITELADEALKSTEGNQETITDLVDKATEKGDTTEDTGSGTKTGDSSVLDDIALPDIEGYIEKVLKGAIGEATGSDIKSQDKERFFETTITQVVDADTVQIQYQGETMPLRVLYINAPEDTKTKEWLGDKATAFARDTLEGKTVTIELSEKDNPTDKYGRLLGSIFVGDTLFQEKLLAEGLAIVQYVYEPDTKYENHLRAVEETAKVKEKNVWSREGYVNAGNNGYDMSVIH